MNVKEFLQVYNKEGIESVISYVYNGRFNPNYINLIKETKVEIILKYYKLEEIKEYIDISLLKERFGKLNVEIELLKDFLKEKKITKLLLEKYFITKQNNIHTKKLKIFKLTPEDAYLIFNGIKKPKCQCGKDIRFISFSKGYHTYCNECLKKEKQNKIKQTFLKKYNVDNPFKSKEIKEKIKQTNLKKYGVEYPIQSSIIKEKAIQTNLERYGVKYSFQNEEIRKKILQTNLKKYGVEYPIKSKKVREKISKKWVEKTKEEKNNIQIKKKQTCLKNFKVDNPMKCNEIKQKAIQTNLERYGVKYSFQNEEIRKKILQTNLKKYGVEYPIQSSIIKEKAIKKLKEHNRQHWKNLDKLNEDFIKENFVENVFLNIQKLCNFYNCSYNSIETLKQEFNLDFPIKKNYITQEEIYNFIKENHNSEVRFNDRKTISPLELDIYLPELNFAIEYNGLMYHSFGKSKYSIFNNLEIDMKIHLRKTERAEYKNIHLFQIFENEWLNPIKQDIWKSKILIKLHSSKIQKLNARDLIIKEVNNTKLVRQFLEENHLQGFIPSSIKIGLFKGNELISLATFGKSRFKKDEFELLRFATKKYTIVRGGLSRILKYLKNYNITSLISYANRRWSFSKSNVYNQVGFQVINNTEPNYFYFKPEEYVLYNRINFQKHKLKDKLEHFDSTLTEVENMFNNGYRLIPDCGNIKYELFF